MVFDKQIRKRHQNSGLIWIVEIFFIWTFGQSHFRSSLLLKWHVFWIWGIFNWNMPNLALDWKEWKLKQSCNRLKIRTYCSWHQKVSFFSQFGWFASYSGIFGIFSWPFTCPLGTLLRQFWHPTASKIIRNGQKLHF